MNKYNNYIYMIILNLIILLNLINAIEINKPNILFYRVYYGPQPNLIQFIGENFDQTNKAFVTIIGDGKTSTYEFSPFTIDSFGKLNIVDHFNFSTLEQGLKYQVTITDGVQISNVFDLYYYDTYPKSNTLDYKMNSDGGYIKFKAAFTSNIPEYYIFKCIINLTSSSSSSLSSSLSSLDKDNNQQLECSIDHITNNSFYLNYPSTDYQGNATIQLFIGGREYTYKDALYYTLPSYSSNSNSNSNSNSGSDSSSISSSASQLNYNYIILILLLLLITITTSTTTTTIIL